MSDQPRAIPPEMVLSVTLPAQQWLIVQQLLGEGPYRLVQPLIGEIQRQCIAQAERQQPDGGEIIPQRINGGIASAATEAPRDG